MVNHFIAVQSFLHRIECFCPDKVHEEIVKINQADIIRVLPEGTYIKGWYLLVEINHHCFYIAIEDLEYYYSNGLLYSKLDIELELNYLNYLIDESLDLADEGKFKEISKEWIKVKRCNEKLEAAEKSSIEAAL